MKRYIPILLAGALLTGCGAGKTPEAAPVAPEQESQAAPAPEGLTLALEHEVYDASLEQYTYVVSNETQNSVCLGQAYTLQQKQGGHWADLTYRENAAFTQEAYILAPGEQLAMTCGFDLFLEEPQDGEYRLVKEAQVEENGGEELVVLEAEFSLGESGFTQEAPYGIPPLESLPEIYGVQEAKRDGYITVSDRGIQGEEALISFLQKVSMNIPCQIRTAQEFSEGVPVVADIRYEGGKFLYRIRSGEDITDHYYSYLVTDGDCVCLANGRDWDAAEQYDSELVYLLPEGTTGLEQEAALVAEMTRTRLETHGPAYTSWSPDGLYSASVAETADQLLMTSPERQETFPMTDRKGKSAAIRSLSWDPDDLLIVYLERGARAFDPVEWKLH